MWVITSFEAALWHDGMLNARSVTAGACHRGAEQEQWL